MQVVVNIPNWLYNAIMECKEPHYSRSLGDAVRDGKPLPKGHGRLGDLDKIKKEMQNYHDDCAKTSEYTRLGFETAIAVVENAKPIIEADKAESEEISDRNLKMWIEIFAEEKRREERK